MEGILRMMLEDDIRELRVNTLLLDTGLPIPGEAFRY